jgi:GT2 family glycosyltransferase
LSGLAVVIVAHRSGRDLERLLPALVAQLRDEDELVVVDNGGNEDLPAARARVVGDGTNRGFAGGANLGAAATTAPLLLFLNPDSVPQPGALDALREAPADWAAWQALVLLPDGGVNTSGTDVHWTGVAWARHREAPGGPAEIPAASGAALVVRRADWDAVGGFDERFFMYYEDVDLCLRLRRAGRGIGIVPAARVEHDYVFAKGDYKWFLLERNRLWTVLSVYPAPLLLAIAPALLALELVLLVVAVREGWLRAKLRAQTEVLRSLPMLRRRRAAVGSAPIATVLSSGLDSPYLSVPAAADRLQAAYWSVVRRAMR